MSLSESPAESVTVKLQNVEGLTYDDVHHPISAQLSLFWRESWLGGVYGHRTKALGVEHFGQTGSIDDLYRHYGIDANAIAPAAQAVSAGRPVRHLVALP